MHASFYEQQTTILNCQIITYHGFSITVEAFLLHLLGKWDYLVDKSMHMLFDQEFLLGIQLTRVN